MSNVESSMKDFKKNLGGAVDDVGESADHAAKTAKKGFLETVGTMGRAFSAIRDMDGDRLLAEVGLERRRSGLQSVLVFSSGFLLGAGAGLLFAPTSGGDLRRKIGRSITTFFGPEIVEKVEHAAEEAKSGVASVVKSAKSTFDHAEKGAMGTLDQAEKGLKNGVSEVRDDFADATSKGRDQTKPFS